MTSKIIKIDFDADANRDYYCAAKFTFLKIDLEASTTYNCHASAPHPIDFNWLSTNPGQLFNTDINVSERRQMLVNQRNASCEQNCWHAEDIGAISPRQVQHGTNKTHIEVISTPEILDLTIGTNCNLSCSYCCKEFSSSWRNDILKNGNYSITDIGIDKRYTILPIDKVLHKLSYNKVHTGIKIQQINNEIRIWNNDLNHLIITGGEPFLDNNLIDIVESAKSIPLIEIYTGLGVSTDRFTRILQQLSLFKNVRLVISAEGIMQFLEFNRYGIKWEEFKQKIIQIEHSGIQLKFHSTLTNLTLFGFAAFYKYFNQHQINLTFAYQPRMMSPYVLDPISKQTILDELHGVLTSADFELVQQVITTTPDPLQKLNIKEFLEEFTNRRPDIDISIFPKHFINWINE